MIREIRTFKKVARGFSSRVEKMGVAKLPKSMRTQKKLLLLGTGRCGTTSMSNLLRKAGLNVPHEVCGRDGTVSHYFSVDSEWYPAAPWQEKQGKKHVGERRSDYEFEHVWHVVRHPLKVIPSIARIFGGVDWEFYEDNGVIPRGIEPVMRRSMAFYLAQNNICEAQAEYRFRIEDVASEWKRISRTLFNEEREMPQLRQMNKGTGFRKALAITWDTLDKVDPKMAAMVYAMARRYGYE